MKQLNIFDQTPANRRHRLLMDARDQIRDYIQCGLKTFSVTVEDREYMIQVQPSGTTTCNGKHVSDNADPFDVLHYLIKDWWNHHDYPGKSFRKS